MVLIIDVTELLSRYSRNQRGFLDFFFQAFRCPTSRREGAQIDEVRLSVAADLGVTIDDFLCPSLV